MKNSIIIAVLFVFCGACEEVFAAETNAANDFQNLLPALEKLWPDQPEEYFKEVRQAAKEIGANKNPASSARLLCLFTNMMAKPLLTNSSQILSCVTLKSEAIEFFLNYEEIAKDKLSLLAIAKHTGDIRSQIIPNYAWKDVYGNVGAGLPPGSPEAIKAIEQNERNKAENYLHQRIQVINSIMTFYLLHSASRFRSSIATNVDFVAKIVVAAHLTEAEQRKLK